MNRTETMNLTRVLVEDVEVGDIIVTYTIENGRLASQQAVVTAIAEDNSDPAVPHRWMRCAGREQPLHRAARSSIAVLVPAQPDPVHPW